MEGANRMYGINVEAAIHHEGKWLIIERSMKEEHAGGLLSFVGGTVENETSTLDILEATVRREVYEEVGVTLQGELKYVHSSSFVTDKGEQVINIVFLAEYKEGEPHVKSIDEVANVYWMTMEELVSHAKAPSWLQESMRRIEARL
jgi:NADH pyrophosphatase NudC (nudix superfamily)